MACTTPQSCEGVGRRSHGDVTIQTGACIGSNACNAAGRRVEQSAPSFRFRSHIDIGPNACVGSNACKDAHSTVNHGTAGKYAGSLTIVSGGCAADGSCEKMGFSDRMRTDLVVPPGGCSSVEGCKGCMTKTECASDEVYIISNVDGACPKGGNDTNNNPTGDKVDEYCIGKDTFPTDCPTFSPTPFPTPLTSSPTSAPTNSPSQKPSSLPSDAPSRVPSAMPSDIPSSLPSSSPSQIPSEEPSAQPSDLPSVQPSQLPSESTQPSALPSTQPSDMPSSSSQPSQYPTRTSSPTVTPASFTVGCLSTPGNGASMSNPIDGDILCDGATGICADFVSMVDALADEGKRKMAKSIFGCNDANPPQPVTLEVAQERFDKIKNDESVTTALLAIAKENTKLFTGSASVVTSACNGSCCSGSNACITNSVDGGVMTVSSGSCIGRSVCGFTRPNAIILDSCKGRGACFELGRFNPDQPAAGVEVGFEVIGPGTCLADLSCNSLGRDIFGNVRVEEGACDSYSSCSRIANRSNQGSATMTPIVASVFIGKNSCRGRFTCYSLHAGNKLEGDVIVEADACPGSGSCSRIGNSDSATNDIIIRAGVCTTGSNCFQCAQGPLCTSDTETYEIDDAATDCPGPVQSACKVV